MAKLLGVGSLQELHLNSKQHLALKLGESQDWKCIYSGKSISPHDIVDNQYLFEIDHIIPISLSFDDSQANKVLCHHSENQKKGQKTPFKYFLSGTASREFDQFKVEVLNLYKSKKITSKKKEYLLELRDIKYNEELQKEFINRNLVDTRYAMRSFSMNLRTYFKTHGIDTKVLSIRGSFTAALRRRARINKDRDESYAHHAIDALIVAAIGRMPILNFFKEFHINEEGKVINKETGEILEEDKFFTHNFLTFLRRLMSYETQVKYSHKVDRKVNRTISNQTIYGTREKDDATYLIRRTSNIYNLNKNDNELKSLLKRINTKPDSFLISQYNPELITLIQKIVKEHSYADNPFREYKKENGYILKDEKVPVKRLKYYDIKLGVHKDITNKYPESRNKVVLLSIKTVRVDIYKNDEGKYKYLGVPYHWFKQEGNEFKLDMNEYRNEMEKDYKKIDDGYKFQLSLYRNDMFSYEKDGKYYERIFIGDKNSRQNQIEVEYVNKPKEQNERLVLTIPTISNMVKYNVDILGNTYKIEKENLKTSLHL